MDYTMAKLEDKKILVTGSTGSYGPYLTDYLVENGARVIGTYISEERRKGEYTAEPDRESEAEVRKTRSDKVDYYEVDLTDPDKLSSFKEEIEEKYGKIDAIVNLVGEHTLNDINTADKKQFKTSFEVHVLTVFLTVKTFAKHLEENNGSIVNMGYLTAFNPIEGALSFQVAKGALHVLTKALNKELEGAQANVLMPFPRMDFPSNREQFPDEDFDEWTDPEDANDTIRYLLTNKSVKETFIRI